MKTAILLLAVTALAAGGSYFYSHNDQHKTEVAIDSQDWPSVSGLVTYSNLEARGKKMGRQLTTDFRVQVGYEYVVDGNRFENDVVQFNQNDLTTAEKELIVSTHPKGRQVEVFYDPDAPERSVLVRGSWP